MLRYEDQSGGNRIRPRFGIAMQRILASEADAIIVWKSSRLSCGRDDEQLERAHAALDETTAALHNLASAAARRELGVGCLPMMSRRAQ